MSLNELLEILGTNIDELESAEPMEIDYLKDDQYSNNGAA